MGKVQGFGHRIPARYVGGSLVFPIYKNFKEEIKIKETDYLLPCLIDSEKLLKEDPVLGKFELIFRYRRGTGKKVPELYNSEESLEIIPDD